MIRLFLTLCLLLAPSTVGAADVAAEDLGTFGRGCVSVRMCGYTLAGTVTESAGTGVCQDENGDEIIMHAGGYYWMSVDTVESDNTVYVCDVWGNRTGYDGDVADKVQITSTSLSNTNKAVTIAGIPTTKVWIECTSNASGAIITANFCPFVK